jgi:hypothetical protein
LSDEAELRAELEALRAENEELKKAQAGRRGVASGSRHRGLRWTVAGVLLFLGMVAVAIAILGTWLNRTVTDTDRYVETVAPLVESPEIRVVVSTRVTSTVTEAVDVESELTEVLPERAEFLAAPISSSLEGLVRDVTDRILASDRFEQLWTEANRVAHETMVAALTGEGDDTVGSVSVDLSGVVSDVAERLGELGIPLPEDLGEDLSLQVFESDEVASAQSAFRAFDRLSSILPWVALGLLVLGIVVAPDRRWGATWAAGALCVGALIVGLTVAVGRGIYLDALPTGASLSANEEFFDTLVRFLRDAARTVLGIGIILLVVALVTGPSHAAVRLRAGVKHAIARAGDSASDQGLVLGQFGTWVADNLVALRWVVGAVAAVTFVAWSEPTAAVVFWIVVIGAVVLGLLEFAARVGRDEHTRSEPVST